MDEFRTERAKRTLLFSLVSVGMGFTVLFPILAPLGREMGLSEIQITTIISASGLVVFLTSPIWGRRSDAWGRKRVLLCGLFGVVRPSQRTMNPARARGPSPNFLVSAA